MLIKETFIMNYKNGYKVVYEVAADGKRTFYASKSNVYPNEEDIELASFVDADYAGKTIYEYAGEFYVANTNAPKFDAGGAPVGDRITGFEKLFLEDTAEVIEDDEEEAGTKTNGKESEGTLADEVTSVSGDSATEEDI